MKKKVNRIFHPKLDLHGVFHADAYSEVDSFISENLYSKKVEIVTGYSKEMKAIVRDVLSDYNLTGKEPLGNSGTLIVNILDKS